MSNLTVPNTTFAVTREPLPAEKTIGSPLWYAVGSGTSAFLNWAMTVIPEQINGIDKQADPFLEELISLLQQLGKTWKEKSEPDLSLLNQVLIKLTSFTEHSNKAQLLYPQIMQAKPSSSSTTVQEEEQKEIVKKKEEATEKTDILYKKQVIPLIACLQEYQNASLAIKMPAAQVLFLIGELVIALRDIAHEQRSLLLKVIHTVVSSAQQAIHEQWEKVGSQKEEFTVNNHPLMQLLAILGKYHSEKIHLPSDQKREIRKALLKIEAHCPLFKGIYDLIDQQFQASFIDLKNVHCILTEFIRGRGITDAVRDEVYIQAASFVKNRKNELIQKIRLDFKQKSDQAFLKMEKELDKTYRQIDNQGTNPIQQKEGANRKAREEYKKLQQKLDLNCAQSIREIEDNPFWLKNLGEAFCLGKTQDIPTGLFDKITIDEIVWKAVVFQQQKKEWQSLKEEISKKEEKDPKAIIKSLQLAIEYLQRYASIEQNLQESEKQSSIELINKYILEWMDYAKEWMVRQEQNSWEKGRIDEAFDKAIVGLRKGGVIFSIKFIQNCIRASSYWITLWKESPSPLGTLTTSFKEFFQTLPPHKPPKSASVVLQLIRKSEETPWHPQFLEDANGIEKEQVLENALALACFEFVAYFLGLNGKKMDQYKRLMDALDKIKRLEENPTSELLQSILDVFLGKESSREKKNLDSLKSCILIYKGNKEFHKQLYLQLVNILIGEQGNNYSISTWTAWSFFSLVYDLIELFIRPFSEQLFSEIDGFVKNPSGTLNQKHLAPIKGITKALSTYCITMEYSWEEEIKRQNQEQGAKRPVGKVLDGTKDDLKVLLDRPDRYEGMTPDQITLKMGYALVDKIRLPDYTKTIAEHIEKVKIFVSAGNINNRILHVSTALLRGIVISPVYLGLHLMYYVVKVITACINFFVQQGVKFYLWKTNTISRALDQVLDSVLVDVESVPILDTLLLEQLKDLLKELEKGTPPHSPSTAAGDDRNKKIISEALEHLFKVIEIDQYKNLDSMKKRPKEGILFEAKKQVYEQLTKLLSTVFVSTSKSLLQKEQVNALLFELFRIANEGLQGGKRVVLTKEQRGELAIRLKKAASELSDDEINQEGRRIALEKVAEIPKVLATIREKAINPAVDKAIDESVQTNSQLLLDYITWIDSRLFSLKEKGNNRNIIYFLKEKLDAYRTAKDKDEILREIHFFYGQFIHEMTEFQTRLDANPSPNAPELNQLILMSLAPPLKELTIAIKNLVHEKSDSKNNECLSKLLEFEKVQVTAATELVKIEEAEKNRVMGMHAGIQGIVQKTFAQTFQPVKEGLKELFHRAVQVEINWKEEDLRNMTKHKTLVKHALLWQMRLFLNPELAFKA